MKPLNSIHLSIFNALFKLSTFTITTYRQDKWTKLEGLPLTPSWLWKGVFLLFSNFIEVSSILRGAKETLGSIFGLAFSVSCSLVLFRTYGVSLRSATSSESISTNETLDGRPSPFTNGVTLRPVVAVADVAFRRDGKSSSSFDMGSWPASIRRISASAWVIRRFLLVNLAAGTIFCLEVWTISVVLGFPGSPLSYPTVGIVYFCRIVKNLSTQFLIYMKQNKKSNST